MLIGPAFKPVIKIQPLIEKNEEAYILLHPLRARFMVLNRVGHMALRYSDGKTTIREIASRIAARYDTDPGPVESDLVLFFQSIRKTWLMASGIEKRDAAGIHVRKLHLNVTQACNLRCAHCALEGGDASGQLTSDEIRAVLNSFHALGGEHVAFSGGEPLLLEDIPDLCIEAARRFSVSLSTNGLLMTPAVFQRMDQHQVAVHLSLDGAGPDVHDVIRGKGAYEGLLRILEAMGSADPAVPHGVYTTLTRQNIKEVKEIIGICKGLGIRRIHFMPLQKMGRAAKNWDRLAPSVDEMMDAYRHLYLETDQDRKNGLFIKGGFQGVILDFAGEERWCGLGSVLAVDADGGIYPCSLMIAPEFLLGNIRQHALKDIISGRRLREVIQQCSAREKEIEACGACSWRNFCQAGCPASNFFLGGTIFSADDLCDIRKALYPALIRKRMERKA